MACEKQLNDLEEQFKEMAYNDYSISESCDSIDSFTTKLCTQKSILNSLFDI